jgi:hypothetical protein
MDILNGEVDTDVLENFIGDVSVVRDCVPV